MEQSQLETTAGGRAKRWVSEARFRGRAARLCPGAGLQLLVKPFAQALIADFEDQLA